MIQTLEESHGISFSPALHGERALSRRWQHELEVQLLPAPMQHSKPFQACARKNHAVVLPLGVSGLAQARVYIPADVEHAETGIAVEDLRGPAAAAGSNRGVCRQLVEPQPSSCNQYITRMSTLQDSTNGKSRRGLGWKVFQAMNCDIDSPVRERRLQFRSEYTLPAKLG